jgi:hypothetical protein
MINLTEPEKGLIYITIAFIVALGVGLMVRGYLGN